MLPNRDDGALKVAGVRREQGERTEQDDVQDK